MLLDLMKKRRSIRKFINQKIENEKLESLKKAALLAPTSKNKQGWEFIFIENKETLEKLSKVKNKGGFMVKDASLAIVVAVKSIDNDVWIEDGSIAATHIYLMAEELGLGCCWVQLRNRYNDDEGTIKASDLVSDILSVPNDMEVLCLLSIGYKAEEPKPTNLEVLKYNKIHYEKY